MNQKEYAEERKKRVFRDPAVEEEEDDDTTSRWFVWVSMCFSFGLFCFYLYLSITY